MLNSFASGMQLSGRTVLFNRGSAKLSYHVQTDHQFTSSRLTLATFELVLYSCGTSSFAKSFYSHLLVHQVFTFFVLFLDHMQNIWRGCVLQMKEQYFKDIKISGVTPSALEEVLNYMYTEKITLSEESVCDVLQAASLMLLTGKCD